MAHAPDGNHVVDVFGRAGRLREVDADDALAVGGEQGPTRVAGRNRGRRLEADVPLHLLVARDHALGDR